MVGSATTTRGTGRPASDAAFVINGTICSRSVTGPVHQVIVPSATPPASASIRGWSAASSTPGGVAFGTLIRMLAVMVSPCTSTDCSRKRGRSAARYSRMWRAGLSYESP